MGGTLVLDREGLVGGAEGGKTCPISAPLPDLILVLPFSSPCLLQAPCFSVSCESNSSGSGSKSLCCKGQVKGPPGVQGCRGVLIPPKTLPLLGLGLRRFRGVDATAGTSSPGKELSSGDTRGGVTVVRDFPPGLLHSCKCGRSAFQDGTPLQSEKTQAHTGD